MQDCETPGVAPSLLAGERILWRGQPAKAIVLRPIDVFLIPFSLFWGGFALFWNFGVWSSGAPGDFKLFGIPFLIVGAYVIFGRFLWDAYRLRSLRYFVTDRRVIITRSSGGSLQSLDIRRLPALNLSQKADGSGTLTFGEESFWASRNNLAVWQATSAMPPRILAIPDVSRVYNLIHTEANKRLD